ncbi:hypothetical protein [Halarcobacter sp.]|uniref:hypothetical protein n=1 Tax=Halarcobacter sp. TaxID=2321133 RepID=UPI003A934839
MKMHRIQGIPFPIFDKDEFNQALQPLCLANKPSGTIKDMKVVLFETAKYLNKQRLKNGK